MTTRRVCWAIVCILICLLAAPAAARETQAPSTAPQLLRVFLDCQYECDTEYLRQNVQFVDYVRDRTVADVHVLVTTQGTGGGGSAWTLKFIGLGRFDKVDRTRPLCSYHGALQRNGQHRRCRELRVQDALTCWWYWMSSQEHG